MVPLSRSAWVTTYDAVQVVEASGASVVLGQVGVRAGPAGALSMSSMASCDTVSLPVLVTRNS